MKSLLTMKLILLFAFLLVSCSNSSDPIIPKENSPLISDTIEQSALAQHPNRNVFGAWKIHLDTSTMTAEIIPARNALAIGHIFDTDLSQFLTVSPCPNCLWIPYLYQAADENFIMGVRMKHPFPNLTGRPDLHGFDVRAIFIGHSTLSDQYGINMMRPDGTEEPLDVPAFFLMNQDGYTSHHDELVTDERYFMDGTDVPGNVNGFLRFFENNAIPEFDPHNPVGHNVMPVGSDTYTRNAIIDKFAIEDTINFYIVADVAYGQSATFQNRTDPQYYLPAFHRTEPWRVEYFIENNNLTKGDDTSTAELVVQVFDWQHGATVDPAYPDPANLAGIPESSNVASVELYMKSMLNDVIIETVPESGTGTPSDPLQYRFFLTNEFGNWNNLYYGIIAVRDELYGQASPSGRMPVPETPAGFPYDTLDIRDYTLYQEVIVNVPLGGFTQTEHENELNVNSSSQFDAYGQLNLDADFFMDRSHKRFQYRWDYDYDGITFDLDGSGLPSPTIDLPPGITDLGLRVRTNTVPPREHIYTIPGYSAGAAFDGPVDTSGFWMATSRQRSHSVAMTDEYCYVAYVIGSYAKWQIELAITNKRTGLSTQHTVATSATHDYFAPSILVVDDGVNDGIYVTFNGYNSIATGLFFNKGNLDGSGFSDANIKTIAAPASFSYKGDPIIMFNVLTNNILVYFIATNIILEAAVNVAHSEDLGDTWINNGRIYDLPGASQYNPSAAFSDSSSNRGFYVVWEDWTNILENGRDIIITHSTDGIIFPIARQLTSRSGILDESYPSISCYLDQIAVAYNYQPDGYPVASVHVMFTNTDFTSFMDHEIAFNASSDFSKPAISAEANGICTIAFGEYDYLTAKLKMKAYKLTGGDRFGTLGKLEILSEILTPIDPAQVQMYPAVVSNRLLNGAVTERFISWTSYENGQFEDPSPHTRFFGTTNGMYHIHSGEFK